MPAVLADAALASQSSGQAKTRLDDLSMMLATCEGFDAGAADSQSEGARCLSAGLAFEAMMSHAGAADKFLSRSIRIARSPSGDRSSCLARSTNALVATGDPICAARGDSARGRASPPQLLVWFCHAHHDLVLWRCLAPCGRPPWKSQLIAVLNVLMRHPTPTSMALPVSGGHFLPRLAVLE